MTHQLMNLPVAGELKLLDDIAEGYKAYQVLAHAVDLGLFEWLEGNPDSTREDIGAAMNINGMFMRSYLQALVDMGLLCHGDERYRNSAAASAMLVRSSPMRQTEWFRSIAAPRSSWARLGDTLKRDRPASGTSRSGPDRDFLQALAQRSLRGELQAVTRAVRGWEGFDGSRRLLDLGGGHGLYAIALCQAQPQLTATVFDQPHVTNFTQEYIEAYQLADRVDVANGDVSVDDFGSGYDIVLISHLLYKFRKDLPAIFRRVWQALNPGGLLVSNHWFCAPGCGMPAGGLVELDKSLRSFGHPLCYPEAFNAALDACGFVLKNELAVPGMSGETTLHLAAKR